jgi:hypothetical protein
MAVIIGRIVILLSCLAFAVNAGVDTGGRSNPGAGVVWGIFVFFFWLFVVNLAFTLLVRFKRWASDKMDGSTYY